MLELRLPGDENMRRDQAMLDAAERGVTSWRVYTWDGVWVSLGRNQVAEEVLVDPKETRWVRRPTGGAAVLHGHDVTVSIAMPMSLVQELNRHLDRPTEEATVWHKIDNNGLVVGEVVSPPGTMVIMSRSIHVTYRTVTSPLVQALNACGVAAILAEDAGGSGEYAVAADCFASTTRNDVIDPRTFSKVCGCALRRTRQAVLLQASIPVSRPLLPPESIIKGGVRTTTSAIDPEQMTAALDAAIRAISSTHPPAPTVSDH